MNLTNEQCEIINSTGNIKINAVAGSGKTTTIVEYAQARPKTNKFLYLAFNKSVKLEAKKKFAEKGLHNVAVETAHSLAFRHIVRGANYKVRGQGYKTHEVAEILKIKGSGEKHIEYVIANHINKFVSYFCNNDKLKVQELNYLNTVTEPKAEALVSKYYNYIERKTREFLSKMDSGEIEITHDFYLKKFQLSNPQLHYDYILFDEGQDASAVMLDVFFKQKATKVIVGDTHQQIYSWRYAVNSLEKSDFKPMKLSTSFRFSQNIADLAVNILHWKKIIGNESAFEIIGKGTPKTVKSKAVVARTNLALLSKAIDYVTGRKVKSVYFEGNINSYFYADEGASLFDVLNLFNSKRKLIKDKLIKGMKNIEELEEYIQKTEDLQLGMLVEIVKEYGNKIPQIIKELKKKHVKDDEKEKAEIIFSTVHRCKGMEYDSIQLANDFITEEKLANLVNDENKIVDYTKLNEEINLLYVAVTRARSSLYIPAPLIPVDYKPSEEIHVMKTAHENKNNNETEQKQQSKVKHVSEDTEKAYSLEKIRAKHTEAYKPWTTLQDDELTVMYCEGVNVKDIAKHLGRTTGAIRSRIKKLELEELYG